MKFTVIKEAKKKIRKILLLLLCFCMLGSSVFVGEIKAASFRPRLTEPSSSDKYWIHTSAGGLNECIMINDTTSCLPNCVGYAWGRAYEILGKKPDLAKTNANTWWDYNINNNCYSYGYTPKLGAIMCWGYSNGGHVAVVEEINGNNITISESWYSNMRWRKYTTTISTMESYYSNFQGYIYLGEYNTISPGDIGIVAPEIKNISVSGNDVTVSWGNVSGAERYHIQLCDGAWKESEWFTTRETSYTFKNLSDGAWVFRVGSQNSSGTESYSPFKYFTVGIPETPVINSIVVTDYDATIEWSPCANAIEYSLQLCDGNWETSQWFFTTSPNYTFKDLESGTWVVRVASINTAGDERMTEYRYFTVAIPETPSVTDVIIDGNNVTLKWDKCDNSVKYNIQLCDEGWMTSQWFSTTNIFYTFENLSDGLWRYRVGSENSKGYETYNEFHTFTVGHEHEYGNWVVDKNATCTTNGSKYRTCQKCESVEKKTIDKLGHSFKKWKTSVYPTCEDEGIESSICDRCDEIETRKIVADGHDFNSVKTKKKATCTEEGLKVYTCGDCGKTKKETISPYGHDYETEFTVDKKATTTKNGRKSKHCVRCDEKEEVTTIYKISDVILDETSYTYSGQMCSPNIVVVDSKGEVISSSDYTITKPLKRKNVGKYIYTIKFKNEYSGEKKVSFKIYPNGTSISQLTKARKAFTVKWDKQSEKMGTSRIKGYQIQYSTSVRFSGSKNTTISGYGKTKKKISGLKSKKTYYVRIRTYMIVSGTKYYSEWSDVESVKTK